MAELEIDREVIHERHDEMETKCFEEKDQPYRKSDYGPIII